MKASLTSELNALESALQQEQTLCPAKRENLQSKDSEFDEVLSAVKRWLNPATCGPRKTVATTLHYAYWFVFARSPDPFLQRFLTTA